MITRMAKWWLRWMRWFTWFERFLEPVMCRVNFACPIRHLRILVQRWRRFNDQIGSVCSVSCSVFVLFKRSILCLVRLAPSLILYFHKHTELTHLLLLWLLFRSKTSRKSSESHLIMSHCMNTRATWIITKPAISNDIPYFCINVRGGGMITRVAA